MGDKIRWRKKVLGRPGEGVLHLADADRCALGWAQSLAAGRGKGEGEWSDGSREVGVYHDALTWGLILSFHSGVKVLV